MIWFYRKHIFFFQNKNFYLGNASQHQVLLVLNATRIPDMSGACSMTPAQSYLDAKSTVGTVPLIYILLSNEYLTLDILDVRK